MTVDPLSQTYQKAAVAIVNDVMRVLREPALDPTPVQLEQYAHLDLPWYRATTTELEAQGFRVVRDVDASHVASPGRPPPAIRVLLSADGRTTVALYHLIPKSPGWFMKLLLWLSGRWPKSPRIVEATSHFAHQLVSTSNQGAVNTFSPAPWVSREALPLGTAASQVVERHLARLATIPESPRAFTTYDEQYRAREEHRVRTLAWRAEVGLLPVELDRMLASHAAVGVAMRPYIERELAARLAAPKPTTT